MKTALFIFILALLIPAASAHLDADSRLVSDGHLIDIGYAPAEPSIADTVYFSFALFNTTTEQEDLTDYWTDFSSVWVRISHDNDIIFSSTLLSKDQTSDLYYRFPFAGIYDIDARFFLDNGTAVSSSFDLEISEAGKDHHEEDSADQHPDDYAQHSTKEMPDTLIIILCLVIGLLAILYLLEKRKNNKKLNP